MESCWNMEYYAGDKKISTLIHKTTNSQNFQQSLYHSKENSNSKKIISMVFTP